MKLSTFFGILIVGAILVENGWALASEQGEEIENRRGWTYYSEASKRAVCAECAKKGFLKNREMDEDMEEERGWREDHAIALQKIKCRQFVRKNYC